MARKVAIAVRYSAKLIILMTESKSMSTTPSRITVSIHPHLWMFVNRKTSNKYPAVTLRG